MNLVDYWWEVHHMPPEYCWCFYSRAASIEEARATKKTLEESVHLRNHEVRILKITAEEVV